MASTRVSAILLAAGESRRMGTFKQLMPYRGKTFVEACVDSLVASRVHEVVVVTGHRAPEIERLLAGRSVRLVHNPDYRQGMSSSVKCGVSAVDEESTAVLIALADQPQIRTRVVDRVISAYEEEHSLIVVPSYKGRRGHPLLLDLRLREEVLSHDPDEGLRQVVNADPSRVRSIEVDSDQVLVDFDEPSDLEGLVSREDPGVDE